MSVAYADFSPTNKWRTIDTKYFQLIYPEEYESNAQRVAWMQKELSSIYYKSLKISKQRKWKIILNSKGMANGFVQGGFPRHSHWYGGVSPSDYFKHGEWVTGLLIHEGRHIAQFDRAFDNLIRFANVLGGEFFSGSLSYLTALPWAFEGEAVNWETRFAPQGRGKTSSFDREFKAILLSDNQGSYLEAVNERYNVHYPNWYVYGYFFVTHMIREYGEYFWDEVTEKSSRFPFPLGLLKGLLKKLLAQMLAVTTRIC